MKNSERPFQKMFEAATQKQIINRVLWEAVREAVGRRGVRLTKSQEAALQLAIRSGDLKKVRIALTKRQQERFGAERLDLGSLDDETIDRLHRENWDKLEPRIPSMLLEIADATSAIMEKDITKRIERELRARGHQQMAFEKQLKRRWKRPLELLQTLVFISAEAAETASRDLKKTAGLKAHVLFRLHARACQVGHEIVVLLRSGFADGAHARWRTLHELAVTGFFIAEHGDPVAERYILHHGVETFKAAELFQKYCKRLGYRSLSKRQFTQITSRKDRLLQKFGKPFGTDYGWADLVIKNGRPTFRDLEETVKLDHLRPYYKLACNNVHAGAKGAFERLGLYERESNLLLAGPSSIGLADPGHGAAISLVQITTCLLLVEPTLDNFVVIRLLDRLQEKIGATFLRIQGSRE